MRGKGPKKASASPAEAIGAGARKTAPAANVAGKAASNAADAKRVRGRRVTVRMKRPIGLKTFLGQKGTRVVLGTGSSESGRDARGEAEPLTFREGIVRSLEDRSFGIIQKAIERMTAEDIQRAVAAPTAAATVVEVLNASPEVGLAQETATTRALARGALVKEEMIEVAGGCLTSSQVAKLLGIGVTAVNNRRARRTILSVPLSGGEFGFPARQFAEREVRPGIAEIVKAAENLGPWVLLSILLDGVKGGSPLIDRLDDPGVRRDVLRRVRSYGTQGGA